MIVESGQFGSFEGLDNRKTVFFLLKRLGHGLPEFQQAQMRADWLRDLVKASENCFAQKMVHLEPCCLADAYFAFVAITGCLGVPVEKGAKLLEQRIRQGVGCAPIFGA